MAIDEAILELVERDISPPTLRLYAWEPACLSIGYAQSILDVDKDRLASLGWDVVRRLTGGRAILHADELTYSVIAPPTDPRVSGSIPESYAKLAWGLLKGLQLMGLAVETQASEDTKRDAPPNPICFQVPATQEIIAQGKKIIGSAQARRKLGVLQHGTLPLIGDLTRITRGLKFESKTEQHSASEQLMEKATTVETAFGKRVDWDVAAQAMEDGFGEALNLSFEVSQLSDAEITRADELERDKYASQDWTNRN